MLISPTTPTLEHCAYRVVCLGSDGANGVCVPDDQISIRAHSHATLPGIQVQDLSCVSAGHSHKHVLVHLPSGLGYRRKKRKKNISPTNLKTTTHCRRLSKEMLCVRLSSIPASMQYQRRVRLKRFMFYTEEESCE